MSTSAFVGTVMIDCNDIDTMVRFWSEALGLEEKVRYPNYVWLSRLSEKGPALAFQRVPEPRQGKNRIHLDIGAEDIENAPDFGAGVATEYILGVAKFEGSVKILLDIDRVLTSADHEILNRVSDSYSQNADLKNDGEDS